MINDLVVHLGDTKTGSTSIQKVLKLKAYRTAGEKICYPTQNHHNALVGTLNKKRRSAQREARFESVYDRLKKSKATLGIVSAEHFQFTNPKLFANVARQFWPDLHTEMRLISYIRPHHEKLLSSYSERVKLGIVSGDFNAFVEEIFESKVLDYAPRLEAWREVFGDRFVAKPFVRSALYDGDVVHDFFKFALGHENFSIDDVATSNTSLTLPQLSLLKFAHHILSTHLQPGDQHKNTLVLEARKSFGRSISEHINARELGCNGAKLQVPAEFVKRIQERYAKDAKAVDENFFGGDAMSNALENCGLKASKEAQSITIDHYFDQPTIAAFSATIEIMAKMLTQNPKCFTKLVTATRLMFE